MRLALEIDGDESLPPLLLVHGFLSSNLQWALNRDALKQHFRLYMVELWGHGHSPAPDNSTAYSVASYIEQFEAIRQEHGIERWSVVGQSFGAAIVLQYALRNPQRCVGVMVTNSLAAFQAFLPGSAGRDRQQAMGQMKALLEKRGLRGLPMHPIHGKRLEESLREQLIERADGVTLDAVYGHFGMMEEASVKLERKPSGCPVYLANGIYESAFQPVVNALPAQWPEIQVRDMKGGHSINLDCADAFNRFVIETCQYYCG